MSYAGGTFDGRWVYFAPLLSQTFLRYDTYCGWENYQNVGDWVGRAVWRTTEWPRKFKLPQESYIYLWAWIDDIEALDPNTSNVLFEIGQRINNEEGRYRILWEKSLLVNGWNRLKFPINEPHDSTLVDSTMAVDWILQNMDYCKIELRLNPNDHRCFNVWFDDLKWVDPGTYRGLHGGYIQDGDIHHEASVIIDTHEWITDNQTLKDLVDDVWPLGFHPWFKFVRWFNFEVCPDSTANYTWMGETRYKIFHRRTDMNSTWILANDADFDLADHMHVDDRWPPKNRHRSPGPDIEQTLTE